MNIKFYNQIKKELICNDKPLTTKELSEITGISYTYISFFLRHMAINDELELIVGKRKQDGGQVLKTFYIKSYTSSKNKKIDLHKVKRRNNIKRVMLYGDWSQPEFEQVS